LIGKLSSLIDRGKLQSASINGSIRNESCHFGKKEIYGGGPKSHIPAHAATTTVAPFRAWRGSQFSVAGGPKGPP